MRISATLFVRLVLITSLTALGLVAVPADPSPATAPNGPETGPNWIQNRTTRLELTVTPIRNLWRLDYARWNPDEHAWDVLYTNGQLLANSTSPDVTKQYRDKWGVYYLLAKAMPTNVQTKVEHGSAIMTFRIQQEDLWIDMRVTLIGDTPFAVFAPTGKSQDDLLPHWKHQLTHPRFFAVSDDPAAPQRTRAYAARDYREKHLLLWSRRYCIAFSPDDKYVYGYFWVTQDRQRRMIQFPRGINASFLDAPYALYGDIHTGEKTDETMVQLGEQLFQQLHGTLFPGTPIGK